MTKFSDESLKILDLGTGKHWQKYIGNVDDNITCVDKSFGLIDFKIPDNIILKSKNIFSYLENETTYFDLIVANRVFEHIDYEKIPYLLYLCKEVLMPSGQINFIVPDFMQIFDTIRCINQSDPAYNFNKYMIDIHTELFNTKEDPHRSIWTYELAMYYMGLENFWKNIEITGVSMDNRDWYLKVTAMKYENVRRVGTNLEC